MRIQFKKGFTPETIADMFCEFIENNGITIGAVNIYVQEVGDNMKSQNTREMFVASPSETAKTNYSEYVARRFRKKIKAV